MSSGPRALNQPRQSASASAGVPANGIIVVRPGDTVYQISQRYGVSPRDIIDANGLRPPYLLRPGDQIRLPASVVHVVRSGDTVSEIAERYGMSMRSLVVANNLRPPYTIRVGDRLRLPGGSDAPSGGSEVTVAARQPKSAPQPPVTASDVPAPGTDRSKPWSGGGQLHFPVAGSGGQSAPVTAAPGKPVPEPRPVMVAGNEPAGQAPQTVAASRPLTPTETRAVLLTPPAKTGRGFTWPVKGRVISGFGPREGGLHNDGINILAPAGSEVRAAENGIVVYAGNELRGFGNLLLVKHDDGYTTAYAHADQLLVGRGDQVQRGQVIATVGQTGNVSQPQLHFEIRKGPRPVDPRKQLPPAQVSMLETD
ncbi:LysM peptidoglycan-binding domain-containing M23 family metallopeptidase [Thalassobaculum sp. OXR-137]|uniref:LysM peptidoglycan-binding domain-containing M23 family metallopeptidase n=1 Tax=Thalassobaculum sp. OXR-137 TaxID=3100173 RepID=UPI002AC98D4A|nr:LysM peptidoglycan-binding domain-containing M23 family metallopeptidase [Thalassobaculum sp. OXR-137]WPZ32984.1 LysM peptidoglycan-binding domain-containing M23 family metallopeptidase [Thalassobaculum sp. OXR-137]